MPSASGNDPPVPGSDPPVPRALALAGAPHALGSGPAALEAERFAISFGGQRALGGVDLRIDRGEVLALLGENGSGKSTFVKILAGYHVPDPSGRLEVGGAPVPLPVPVGRVREIGLSFVFQELGLATGLTVVENLFAAHRNPTGLGALRRIAWRAEHRTAREIFLRYDVDLPPHALVRALSPTSQALLAIVRAAEELREFRQGPKEGGVLVLDEPTVFLPEHEKIFLFDLVRRVVQDGVSVLFVSHDMGAVREIAQRAVILRDGRVVGNVVVAEVSDQEIVKLISGYERREAHRTAGLAEAGPLTAEPAVSSSGAGTAPDTIALAVEHLSGGRLKDLSLGVAAGEIVGVAGLLGSGTEDLPYVLMGSRPGSRGRITCGSFSGDVSGLTPRAALRLGMALVPADRSSQSVAQSISVEKNMLSLVLGDYFRRGTLSHRRLRKTALDRCARYRVRPANPALEMIALSGGNQQKVVLAKWLELDPRILLLHEPTHGVDVTTRAEIHELMRSLSGAGKAILWVSDDFDELAKVCDRIVVCESGAITAQVPGPPFTRDQITAEVYASSSTPKVREVSST
ncbi:MAG: sugar ABC transporter ATP-binding protein [Acidimicrobiales bacterium]